MHSILSRRRARLTGIIVAGLVTIGALVAGPPAMAAETPLDLGSDEGMPYDQDTGDPLPDIAAHEAADAQGYALNQTSNVSTYTVRLVQSANVETFRPVIQTVASTLNTLGVARFTVASGTVSTTPALPAVGEIYVTTAAVVSCPDTSTAYAGCASTGWQQQPNGSRKATSSKIQVLASAATNYTVAQRTNLVGHEIGHALGLAHVATPYRGTLQTMYPSVTSVTPYQAGDKNGLRSLANGGGVSVSRIGGADRYAQSALVSQAAFPGTAPVVYLASGENFPDALVAAPAAAKAGGPLLLTAPTALPAATTAELTRLKPSRIVVAGGSGVVSDSVLSALGRYAPTVVRAGGADRYATSRDIVSTAFSTAPTLFVASGEDYPDAIPAGAAAVGKGAPVLLVPGGNTALDATTRSFVSSLKPASVVVVGGSGVVSDGMLASLKSVVPNTTRASGADRFESAASVAGIAFPTASRVYVTTGVNFPDGLTGAVLAGRDQAPMLLSQTGCMPDATFAAFRKTGASSVVLLGGTGVLTADVAGFLSC